MLKFAGALQGAGPRLRARLHHRLGREDVQVARHRHQPAALPRARHEPRVAALLHRGQAERQRRGHRLQSRRLRRAGQQRPGRQVRQHREPVRRRSSSKRFGGKLHERRRWRRPDLEQASAVRDAARDRALLRGARIRQGAAAKSWSSPTRSTSYVDEEKPWELAKAARARRAAARRLLERLEAFRMLTMLPGAGAAARWPSSARAVPRACPRRPGRTSSDRSAPEHAINAYQHLMTRVEEKQLDALFDIESVPQASRAAAARGEAAACREHEGAGRDATGRSRSTISTSSICASRRS